MQRSQHTGPGGLDEIGKQAGLILDMKNYYSNCLYFYSIFSDGILEVLFEICLCQMGVLANG